MFARFLLAALTAATFVFADDTGGKLDDPSARIRLLKTVAEKVPFTPYVSSQRSLFKNGDSLTSSFQTTGAGAMDLEPYAGDWMPLKGSAFNSVPFQSMGVRLTRSPGAFARRELLAPWLREMGENHLNGLWGPGDTSHPLTVIAKLNLFDQRLRATGRGSLDLTEVLEPGTSAPSEGSFQLRYFQARGSLGLHYFFEPGVPDWWGFCDRVAVTNLQRSAHKILDGFPGAFCGNVPFARTDLEDALSFFHPMPDAWKRYGVNRGNLTEPESLSPELMAWEEISGNRPLTPDVFSELLSAHVKAGGKGVIFDEATMPDDPFYSFDGIWNRPIFSYSTAVAPQTVSASELSPLLLARYGEWISKRLALPPRQAMLQAKEHVSAMAKESNDRYNVWLGSIFRERALSTGFKTAEELPAMPPSRRTEDDYRESFGTFRTELKIFWSEVEDYSDTLDNLKDKAFTLEVKRIAVSFPRHRIGWDGQHAKLFSRTFHAVRLKHGTETSPWSWYAYSGDYPPDLAIVPEAVPSKNAVKLGKLLKSCTPVTAIESAVQRLASVTPATAKPVLKDVYASCAVRYLDKGAVAALTKADPKEWDRAVKRCQTAWPDVAITSELNDSHGTKYDFR